MTGVTAGLFKIGDAVSDLAKGIQQCDDSVKTREMEILANMYDAFKHPKSLAKEAQSNFMVNGVKIYLEMSAAYTAYNEAKYEQFGKDIGIAMALVFIGAGDSNIDT